MPKSEPFHVAMHPYRDLPIGIVVCDADGCVRGMNPAYAHLCELDASVPLDAVDYFSLLRGTADSIETERELFREVLDRSKQREATIVDPDPDGGRMRAIRKTFSPLSDERDTVVGVIVSAIDQSALYGANEELDRALRDLRTAQQQLVESAKMASLGSLVAGVAHEINTPVGNAITAISRISDDREQIVRALGDGTLTERAFTDFLDSVGTAVRIIDSNLSKASQLVGTFKQVAADRATEEVREFTLND